MRKELFGKGIFIRLRKNTLQLVVAKRKFRRFLRGCRDEWHGDPPKLEERRRVGFVEFRFDITQLAAGSFIVFEGMG